MRFKLKSHLFSSGTNSDTLSDGIWVNVEGKSDAELDLRYIYSLKTFKYHRIYLLLKDLIRTEFGSGKAIFQGFDGKEIQGHIYQKVFTSYNTKISIGNLLELVNVSVLNFDGVRQLFLDENNIGSIVLAKDYSVVKALRSTASHSRIGQNFETQSTGDSHLSNPASRNTANTWPQSRKCHTDKSSINAAPIFAKQKSSGRLRLIDVLPLVEKNIPVEPIVESTDNHCKNADIYRSTNTIDDYELLSRELADEFEEY